MQSDEQAIRQMVETWLAASQQGDSETLLNLMSDDVLFITPGREPFGKEAFASKDQQMKDMEIDGNIDIKEIKVLGDWAWMRTHIEVTMTSASGEAHHRAGSTLSILRKEADGRWVLARDANLLPG